MGRQLLIAIVLCLCASFARAQQTTFVPSCSGNAAADTAAVQSIVAAAAGSPRTIQFPYKRDQNTLCKLNSITFAPNITLDFTQGGTQVVTGETVAVRSPILAPPAKKIFYNALSGEGIISLSGSVYPDWWAMNTTPGVTDMTAAINAADLAVCAGTFGDDGVTRSAQGVVRFSSTTYKITGVGYRGAPWIGDGPNNTTLDYYGSGAAIDAVGTRAARRQLNISNMFILGSHASAGGYGLRLGWNQRSFKALNHVNFQHFPSYGIYFADENEQMSFYDVAVIDCGGVSSKPGIGIVSDGNKHLYQMNWFNLQLENNGKVGSRVAGGIEADGVAAVQQWSFFGGILQSNRGVAEVRFTNAINIGLFGVYLESDPAATGVIDGIVLAGVSTAVLSNVNIYSSAAHAGSAISLQGAAKVSIDNLRVLDGAGGWTIFISATDTAQAWMLSLGYLTFASPVSIARTARLFWPGNQSLRIPTAGIVEYPDNAAALAAGRVAGDLYRTGDLLKIVH